MEMYQRNEEFDKNQMTEDLPHELVRLDILSWLPVETIYKFRSVCKDWCSLPDDQKFVEKHLTRSLQSSNVIIMSYQDKIEDYFHTLISFYSMDLSDIGNEPKLMFMVRLEVDLYSIDASVDGLVCFSTVFFNNNIYVCNPSTHELVQLPQVDPSLVVAGFGYDQCTRKYKVLCASAEVHLNNVEWYIYTLGSGEDSWRSLGSLPFTCQIQPWESAYIHGAVHWITKHCGHSDPYPYGILSFNFSDESFLLLPTHKCPPWSLVMENGECHLPMHLKVMGGYLRLIATLGEPGSHIWTISIWTLKEYKNYRWTRDIVFSIDMLNQNTTLSMPAIPVDMRNDKMFLSSLKKLYCHDLKTCITAEICDAIPSEAYPLEGIKYYLANYSESLVSVNSNF